MSCACRKLKCKRETGCKKLRAPATRKPSDRLDNSEPKIRNRETCREADVTVSSVVYKATGFDHRCKHLFSIVLRNRGDRIDNLKLYSVFGSGFLIDHALRVTGWKK